MFSELGLPEGLYLFDHAEMSLLTPMVAGLDRIERLKLNCKTVVIR